MSISYPFLRFTFGAVITPIRDANIILHFDTPRFKFRTGALSKESIRDLFKHLDFEFPRDEEGKPLSYTKLTTKQLHDHVAWIELKASESGFTMPHIEREWALLMEKIK